MKPATRLKSIAPNLYGWTSLHTQWKIFFWSYALRTPAGVVIVDPVKPGPTALKALAGLGEPLGIFLTNAHHDRDADWFRKEYEIQIYAHEKAKPDCDTTIDVPVMNDEKMPGGIRAVYLAGNGPGETAFHAKQDGGIVLIGDALIHPPREGLSFLPDQYCEDPAQAKRSVKQLLALDFKIATFGHGEPITTGAKRQIQQFLEQSKRKPKRKK